MQPFHFAEVQLYAMLNIAVFIENERGEILIQQSGMMPIKDKWILPSGYVHIDDDNIEAGVMRCVKEQLRMDVNITHLIDVLGDPNARISADPRCYAVQVLYKAQLAKGSYIDVPTATVKNAKFIHPYRAFMLPMGFNHKKLLWQYLQKKKKNVMISADRTMYDEHFGTDFQYEEKDYMHLVVKGIILNEKNEILLGHRAKRPYKDHWDLIGGHMYVHESVKDCLTREIHEELGLASRVGELFQIYSDKGMNPRFSRAMVLYFVTLDSTKFIKNVEIDDFQFFPLDKLPAHIAYHNEVALADLREYLRNE